MRGLKLPAQRSLPRIFLSHPSRMRGLKHERIKSTAKDPGVASFTDAWIETE